MPLTIDEQLDLDRLRRLATSHMAASLFELALDLDIFGKLAGKALTLAELAEAIGLPEPSARLMGQFLCREGILLLRDGRLSNSPAAERQLAVDHFDRAAIRRLLGLNVPAAALRDRLERPPVVHWYQLRDRGDMLPDQRSGAGGPQEGWLTAFQAYNHPLRIELGERLAAVYDFSGHRQLLDVGGASGGWCVGIRKTNPHLRCVVFDLPDVEPVAAKALAEAGEGDRVRFAPGSFFADALPTGADVALVANVLHNWTRPDDLEILARIHAALDPGGTLLVSEFFSEDDWTGRAEAVFEAFVLLGPPGQSGWQPSYREMEDLLTEAGFEQPERRHGLVLARKGRR